VSESCRIEADQSRGIGLTCGVKVTAKPELSGAGRLK
jgi:hypothetical protein